MFFSIRANAIVGLVLFFMLSLPAADEVNAKTGLTRALETSHSASFKAVHKGKRTNAAEWAYTLYYQLRSPDFEKDKFVYRRIDFLMPMASDYESESLVIQSNRQNPSGTFKCSGKNIAIIAKEPLDWWPKINPQWDSVEVKVGVGDYHGIPCRKYTLTVKKESPFYGKFSNIVYLAGKDNDFIYSWVVNGPKKESIAELEFGDVDFAAKLSAELFQVPGSAKKIEATTPEEQRELLDSGSAMGAHANEYLRELQEAIEMTRKINFSAKKMVKNANGNEYWRTFDQWFDEKENMVFQRYDSFFPKKEIDRSDPDLVAEARRLNSDGYFHCYGKYAIRIAFPERGMSCWRVPPIPSLSNAKIAINRQKISHDGIPCYEYTVRYPADYPLESYQNQVVKYVVGEDRPFVYAWTIYLATGEINRGASFDLGEVNFSPTFAESFFRIDKDAKVYAAKSADQFESIRTEVLAKWAKDSRRKYTVDSANKINWDSVYGYICQYGVWFTLSLAIATAGFAAYLKIKAYCKR